MNKKNGLKNYVMAVILVIVAVLIDQYTKYLAVTHLKDGPAFVLIDNVFELADLFRVRCHSDFCFYSLLLRADSEDRPVSAAETLRNFHCGRRGRESD